MGRETKTFRQTKRAGSADYANKSYARINRQGGWGGGNKRIDNSVQRIVKKELYPKR